MNVEFAIIYMLRPMLMMVVVPILDTERQEQAYLHIG